MTKHTHTQGPWAIDDNTPRANSVIAMVEHIKIYDLSSSMPLTDPEVTANARLIASAPDLLEALTDIINVMPDDNEEITLSKENIQSIKRLIKKAKDG